MIAAMTKTAAIETPAIKPTLVSESLVGVGLELVGDGLELVLGLEETLMLEVILEVVLLILKEVEIVSAVKVKTQ